MALILGYFIARTADTLLRLANLPTSDIMEVAHWTGKPC